MLAGREGAGEEEAPAVNWEARLSQGLQGRLTQPDFPAQETMPREAKAS